MDLTQIMASSSKHPQKILTPLVSLPSTISRDEAPALPLVSPSPMIPDALRSLLEWNPPSLRQQRRKDDGSTSKAIDTSQFYNKHLATNLVLNHLRYHPGLASLIAGTVDTAIEAALANGGTLPPPSSGLMKERHRDDHLAGITHTMLNEISIALFYQLSTALLCVPIASTLALHPKMDRWVNLLTWTMASGITIAGGSLQILDIDYDGDEHTKRLRAEITASMDPGMLETVRKLATVYKVLALWEIKSLTVGNKGLMIGLKKLANSGRPFDWKKCLCDGTLHKLDHMDAVSNTRAGPDAPTTQWTLPEIYEESTRSIYDYDTADEGSESEIKDTRDNHTRTVRASSPIIDDRGTASVLTDTDTEGEALALKDKGKGRAVKDPGPSGIRKMAGYSSPTKRKRDSHYKSSTTVNAESFVQQAWARAVCTDATIIVLHAGNYEFVCVRHRKTQTLYVSDIIHPPTCKAPAYGKLHIGIYIAAVQDAIRRMEYGETLLEEQRSKLPLNFAKFNKKDKDRDGGKDGGVECDAGGRTRGGTKRQKRDGDVDPKGRGKGEGSRSEKGTPNSKSGRRTRGNLKLEQEEQSKTILEANRRDVVLVFLRYGIYNSPNPAAFFRKAPAIIRPGLTPTPPPAPKPRKQYAAGTYSTIIITSEVGQGSIGKVHGGTLTLNDTDDCIDVKVVVKLSFDEESQERLLHEYFIYRHLDSKGVKGIPIALGLFVDPEDGPSALVLTHGGQSIFHRSSNVEYFQREAFLAILKAIHAAGVLHGDIRRPNLLIDEFGESSIIDFDQAEKNDSERARESELKKLARILEAKGEY